jgi:Zn-finger nucleic acid-binding protein
MLCINCKNEVPSKFSYAIKANLCPFCGDAIMAAELQKVLNGLHEIMSLAVEQSYDNEAVNWISSNFNLVPRDSEEFTSLQKEVSRLNDELRTTKEKFVKPIPKSGKVAQQSMTEVQFGVDNEGHQVQLQGDAIQDPEVTQTFMDRANTSKLADRNDHFRKIVSQIKKSASSASSGNGGSMVITPAMLAAADPTEIEEMENMLSGGVPIVSSGIDADYDDEDALPPIAEAFIAGGSGKQVQGYNPRDIAKLQQLQQKSAKASRALDGGGSVGLIRR